MLEAQWLWQLAGTHGPRHGYVAAIDPRDALSRALTSETASGRLLGEEAEIPAEVFHGAPGNFDTKFEVSGKGFTVRVQKVVCPSEARHESDVVGCGSTNVSGPDNEGLFDCQDCGVFFNPMTAY